MSVKNLLALELKRSRQKKNLTQAEVADRAGISRSYYADLETERYNPTLETLVKLAPILDLSLDDLAKKMTEEIEEEE